MPMKKITTWINIVVAIIVFTQLSVYAQIRAGSAFLKMQPGSRAQAMGGAYTAVIDDPHGLYANPGGVGFMQEWQWSASYSKWIADIYNTSFIYGRRIAMPWSQQTRFALGIAYQGMPEFDSSGGMTPVAGASDMLASLSIGQPLTFMSNNLSIGANFKYLSSTLAQYSASTFVTDVGAMWKTRPINLGNPLFPQAVWSLGAAMTQRGGDLTYASVGTPLPTTMRVGTGLYLGSYDGLRFTVSADYISVKDMDPYVALGGELMINQLLAVNAGYNMGNELVNKLTFGMSIKLGGKSAIGKAFPGKGNAVRVDFATLDGGDFFSRTYQGTLTHQSSKPQPFKLVSAPATEADTLHKDITLAWTKANDNDVFDKVNYTVVADQDSLKIRQLLDKADKENKEFDALVNEDEFDLVAVTTENEFEITNASGGEFFWTVAATDLGEQTQLAVGEQVRKFIVPLPDIEILDTRFEYASLITNDDYQGTIKVTLRNNGMRSVSDVNVTIDDRVVKLDKVLPLGAETNTDPMQAYIAEIAAEETKVVEIPWHTRQLGEHELTVNVNNEMGVAELNDENNIAIANFTTIPKGVFATTDTAVVYSKVQSVVDLPFLTQISFDKNKTKVKPEYLHKTTVEPYLKVLAERLVNHPQDKISLKGYVDPNSEESDINLANARALAVRDSLLTLGVQVDQIVIAPGEILTKRRVPQDAQDAKWVFQERRYVQISAKPAAQAVLFSPVLQKSSSENSGKINFNIDVTSSIPIDLNDVEFDGVDNAVKADIRKSPKNTIIQECRVEPAMNMIDKASRYALVITDEQGRRFRTEKQTVFVSQTHITNEQRYGVSLEFGKVHSLISNPYEDMYRLALEALKYPNAVIKFEGHACAIGSAEVNKRLSEKRASAFHTDFMNYVRKHHKADYERIKARMQKHEGFGESRPYTIETASGKKLVIGDNNSAIGRKLNRRIEMVIYRN